MRRFVTLTLILTTATTVAGVYLREMRHRDQALSAAPIPPAVNLAEGLTHHGLIVQVDIGNRSLEIEENGRHERFFWDDHTLITVAKHRVKTSALAPGARVMVDAQQRDNRLQASLIAVSLPHSNGASR